MNRNPLSFQSNYAGLRNEANVILLFVSYWERGVNVAESMVVYIYAVIRRCIQVCVCLLRYVPHYLRP